MGSRLLNSREFRWAQSCASLDGGEGEKVPAAHDILAGLDRGGKERFWRARKVERGEELK
jgi:hypothetical protein